LANRVAELEKLLAETNLTSKSGIRMKNIA